MSSASPKWVFPYCLLCCVSRGVVGCCCDFVISQIAFLLEPESSHASVRLLPHLLIHPVPDVRYELKWSCSAWISWKLNFSTLEPSCWEQGELGGCGGLGGGGRGLGALPGTLPLRGSSSSWGGLATGSQGDKTALPRASLSRPWDTSLLLGPLASFLLVGLEASAGGPFCFSQAAPLYFLHHGAARVHVTLLPAPFLENKPLLASHLFRALDTVFVHGGRFLLLFLYFLIISLAVC